MAGDRIPLLKLLERCAATKRNRWGRPPRLDPSPRSRPCGHRVKHSPLYERNCRAFRSGWDCPHFG